MNTRIRRVLVANRGEIAVRVIRACRDLGIYSIAVFSDVDRELPHVRLADEAYCLGDPAPRQSYLNIERIVDVARTAKADAIHPGYGFLAENPRFAQAVCSAGFIFVGPPTEAISLMGDKAEARRLAARCGVPILRGIEISDNSDDSVTSNIDDRDFPLLVKAVAGGGGKGMRLVCRREDLASAVRAARSEALNSFGDSRVYVERYLEEARHIEVQVLADQYGHTVHLGERECSIQRRHQKIVEESPSVAIDDQLRAQLGTAAVMLTRECGYCNAGTVEFLLDKNKRFYFLEMNTRVQVEHPVTEMVTGVDIVQQQLRIAAGEHLDVAQEAVRIRGHAVECRIYAEDPLNNFFPSLGRLRYLRTPVAFHTRVDIGFDEGNTVPVQYDPIIAKVLCHGRTRTEALDRMVSALCRFHVVGVATNLSLCRWIMEHERFRRGDFHTRFLDTAFDPQTSLSPPQKLQTIAAIVAAACSLRESPRALTTDGVVSAETWRRRVFD
jgi:acetyl-CoA carboxylase biotin carboxylase subunit